MGAGITFAQRFNLRPGIALSPHQVAQLTSDIVWLETESVTLPNGKVENVLVPKVYALAKKGDITGKGSLLSGSKILHKGGEFINQGTVAGRALVKFDSESVRNTGNISSEQIAGNIQGDVENIGGTMEADRAILLNVAGNFTHQSRTHTTKVNEQGYQRTDTIIGRKGLLHVKGTDGTLHINANNINVQGADILNDGQGQVYLSATNRLNLTASKLGFEEQMGEGNHMRNESAQTVEISRVKGNGKVVLSANNIQSEGAALEAKEKLALLAQNDVVLNGASQHHQLDEYHRTKSGGALARSTNTTQESYQAKNQQGTQLSGNEVFVSAKNNLEAKGLQAIAEKDLELHAGNNIHITADTNHFKEAHYSKKSKSGMLTGGGIGVTFGKQSEIHQSKAEGWTQSDARGTLGSMQGNIHLTAGNQVNVMGTDMITPNTQKIDITAKGVTVEASKDIIHSKERHEYKQSGLTLALSTPVTDTAIAASESVKRAKNTKNDKLKGLYAMKAAEEMAMAAQHLGNVASTVKAISQGELENSGTSDSPSLKASVSYGSQKQTQESESRRITHQKSNMQTGELHITALGEKVTLEGVDATADLIKLDGKQGIEIKGVKDQTQQRTESRTHSAQVGAFIGVSGNHYGVGAEASANIAKGKSNSQSEAWQNSQLNAGKIITDSKEGGLTLEAANFNTKRWEGDIQHLALTSRQDTESYRSKQTSAGMNGSLAAGKSSVSLNAAYNKAGVDYAQVNQQTGINVGEDGMDVTVHNHAQLNGAIIDSKAEAKNNRLQTKSISATDIENKSEIETKSAGMGVGSGGMNPMQAISSAMSLLGNTHQKSSSTTKSAISQNINVETETPENLTALSRDTKNANQQVSKQDLAKAQERQEMAKVIGELSAKGLDRLTKAPLQEAESKRQQAEAIAKTDPTQAKILTEQAKAIEAEYGLGSSLQMGVRAVTAVLQGLAANDLNQAAVGFVSPYLNKIIKEQTTNEDGSINRQANLIAHAILGAIEAKATGNNALASATAAFTAEAAAPHIMQALYNTENPADLTESQKQNVVNLSQIAAGLSGGLVGDSRKMQ